MTKQTEEHGSAKTGHLSSLIRVFALRIKSSYESIQSPCRQRGLQSDWADVQSDQSESRCVHKG